MNREAEYNGWTNYHTWRYVVETGLYDHEDSEVSRAIRSAVREERTERWRYNIVQSVRVILERNGHEMFDEALDAFEKVSTNNYMTSLATEGINDARQTINWWELAATLVSGDEGWDTTPEDRAWLNAARRDERSDLGREYEGTGGEA